MVSFNNGDKEVWIDRGLIIIIALFALVDDVMFFSIIIAITGYYLHRCYYHLQSATPDLQCRRMKITVTVMMQIVHHHCHRLLHSDHVH